MNDLLSRVIDAHGGLTRWRQRRELTSTIVTSGGLWPLKGLIQDMSPRSMGVMLHEQRASVAPFGQPDWRTRFTADRVAVETTRGDVVRERLNPRASFTGHAMNTPWDPLHRAYFNGYAMWLYLTTPFFMATPGFVVSDLEPWKEGTEVWRGLRVRFPDHVATHSAEQDFYFGPDHLLRRHDYRVDVAGGFAAAQYVHDIVEVDGFKFPSRRRAYFRGPDLQPVRDLLLVSIDLRDIRFV